MTCPGGSREQSAEGWLPALEAPGWDSMGCMYSTLKCLIKRKSPNQHGMGCQKVYMHVYMHIGISFCQILGFVRSVRWQAPLWCKWSLGDPILLSQPSPFHEQKWQLPMQGVWRTWNILKTLFYDIARASHTVIPCSVHFLFLHTCGTGGNLTHSEVAFITLKLVVHPS